MSSSYFHGSDSTQDDSRFEDQVRRSLRLRQGKTKFSCCAILLTALDCKVVRVAQLSLSSSLNPPVTQIKQGLTFEKGGQEGGGRCLVFQCEWR